MKTRLKVYPQIDRVAAWGFHLTTYKSENGRAWAVQLDLGARYLHLSWTLS